MIIVAVSFTSILEFREKKGSRKEGEGVKGEFRVEMAGKTEW